MTYLNGGYSIIKKDDANIFAKVNDALTNGKPILLYENESTCYFIDSISKSGDDIIITKGGKTFTISDANVVTEIGDIQNHLYNNEILIGGNDSSDNSIYLNISIVSNKEMTYDDVINYIKTFVGFKYLTVSGYNGDSGISYINIHYNNDKYYCGDSSDNDEEITLDAEAKITSTQIF